MNAQRRPFLTVKSAAELLGCTRANVYVLIESGELPYVTIGPRKGYRIDPADLDEFIEARKAQRIQRRPRRKPPRPKLKHIQLK